MRSAVILVFGALIASSAQAAECDDLCVNDVLIDESISVGLGGRSSAPPRFAPGWQDTPAPVVLAQPQPPEKRPLLIGGGMMVVGGGVLLATAFASPSKPQKGLRVASVALMTVGAGAVVWGVLLDADGAGLQMRVRR